MYSRVENRKNSLLHNSSSKAMNNSASGIHQVSRSSRYICSFTGSQTRRSSILADGGNRENDSLDRSGSQSVRTPIRVLDNDGKDVTPLPLYHAEPGVMSSDSGKFLLDEIFSRSGSDLSKSTSDFSVLSSSSFMGSSLSSSPSSKSSLTKESEVLLTKRDKVKQHVTEEMLDEAVDICLSETDTVSLLDIPNTFVSAYSDDAEAIEERNIHYAELCKNRMGNNKYVERSTQTFSGAPKNKCIQSDKIISVDDGSTATIWAIYDSFCDQNKNPGSTVNTGEGQEKTEESHSSSTGSTLSSLLEMEMCGNSLNAEPDPQLSMLSGFQQSLFLMERNIVGNIFQPKLAAYRRLPIIEDPDSTVKPEDQEVSGEGEDSSSSPTLERLWAFSCELTRRWNVTSMALNKENPDILAVGYGGFDLNSREKGLMCCWSLKNPTWPDRVLHCHSCVTSLDFSADDPGQLAVGMYDGSIAIYDVYNMACIANSSKCSNKHLHPVWQVSWIRQKMSLSRRDTAEALVSVSADGRISMWFHYSKDLDCINLMKLKRIQNIKMKSVGMKSETECVLSTLTPGLCVTFHPTDSCFYLAGTWEGLIHKCSLSESHQFLDTYQKHFCPVNHIEWSPFNSDVFLSCSSDWTIQLWKQDRCTPVLSFTSTQRAVCSVRWSPNWPTIFAAINDRQVQIWDLNSSILDPIIVHHAAPGVKVTSLLFVRGTDCILVGDTDGQVTVYQLKNLSVGEGKQVDSLEDIVDSAISM